MKKWISILGLVIVSCVDDDGVLNPFTETNVQQILASGSNKRWILESKQRNGTEVLDEICEQNDTLNISVSGDSLIFQLFDHRPVCDEMLFDTLITSMEVINRDTIFDPDTVINVDTVVVFDTLIFLDTVLLEGKIEPVFNSGDFFEDSLIFRSGDNLGDVSRRSVTEFTAASLELIYMELTQDQMEVEVQEKYRATDD